MADTVKVAVRVRPFNQREKDLQSKLCVRMQGQTTYLINPETGKERSFAFDYSFWSHNPGTGDPNFVTQDQVFDQVGKMVLDNAFEGYNCTIFAYGQTGAGKSFTMVGGENNETMFRDQNEDLTRGLIPRLCHGIFERIKKNTNTNTTFNVEASMMEIYNEKLHDLLNPEHCKGHSANGPELRIRESPTMGPFVEGLTTSAVNSYEDLSLLMATGTRHRTIGATSMNQSSSRAHTIVTVVLTQTTIDKDRMQAMDKVSRINLVDLAGSERQGKAESSGDRLKEGCAINKSLSALGKCITMIANGGEDDGLSSSSYMDDDVLEKGFQKVDPKAAKRPKDKFIPYRDSALTWLLSESLGGNAKTLMIAAISPADFNYAETLSTLRYAWQAKQIKTRAVVNEDPNERLIRELKEEIMALRRKLGGDVGGKDNNEIELQLKNSEEMIANLNKTWEQRLKETETKLRGSKSVLQPIGGAVAATSIDPSVPFLLNLHEDPTLSKNLAYPVARYSLFGSQPKETLPPGFETAASKGATVTTLTLQGVGIFPEHCVCESVGRQLFVTPVLNARVCLNGMPLKANERREMQHNDRVVMGMNHVFLVSHPDEAMMMTPRRLSQADWTTAMEEVLAAMHQKFFDPSQQQKQEQEMHATLMAIKEKEKQLEEERERYKTMLQEIEVERQQYANKRNQTLENKIRELEARLKLEGRAGDIEAEKQLLISRMKAEDIDAMDKIETRKQQLLHKQNEVDDRLQAQQEKMKIFKLTKEKERREVARAEEHIMQLIPYVDEANIMSEEMNKLVGFEVRLQSSVSPEIYEDPVSGETMHKTHVEAGVYVTYLPTDQSCMWGYDKFMNRLYMMREHYEEFLADPNFKVDEMQDPFFDKSEPVEVGKGHLWLMGLSHLIDTEDTIPLISKLGDNEGKIVIKVLLADRQGNTSTTPYDHVDSITKLMGGRIDLVVRIDAIRGLDSGRYTDIFVRFRFFDDDRLSETRPMKIENGTAIVGYSRHVTIERVGADFVNFLQSDALTVEVWGTATLDVTPANVAAAAAAVDPATTASADDKASINAVAAAAAAASGGGVQFSSKDDVVAGRRQSTKPILGRPKSMMISRNRVDSNIGENKVLELEAKIEEKDMVVTELAQKLDEAQTEKVELIEKLEILSTEVTYRIPELETRVSDLELENQRLRALLESVGALPGSARNRALSANPPQKNLAIPEDSIITNSNNNNSTVNNTFSDPIRRSGGAVRSGQRATSASGVPAATAATTAVGKIANRSSGSTSLSLSSTSSSSSGSNSGRGAAPSSGRGTAASAANSRVAVSSQSKQAAPPATAAATAATAAAAAASAAKAATQLKTNKDRLDELKKKYGN